MKPRLFKLLLLASTVLGTATARAQTADEPDDPKLARRLGTRMEWVSPPSPPVVAARPPVAPPTAVPETAPLPATTATAPAEIVSRTAAPPAGPESVSPPRLKLGFRRFDFVRLGATGSTDGTAASEPFNSLSIDVYPLSSFVRIGLSTQYGWQSGSWATKGDYFATESLSLGVQLLGRPVVPFAEGFAGIGYMRRLQFDRTIPTAYWQLGLDVGAELYLSRVGYVSLALGYLRPVNGFVVVQQFTSAFVDTWSFKLGIGI